MPHPSALSLVDPSGCPPTEPWGVCYAEGELAALGWGMGLEQAGGGLWQAGVLLLWAHTMELLSVSAGAGGPGISPLWQVLSPDPVMCVLKTRREERCSRSPRLGWLALMSG